MDFFKFTDKERTEIQQKKKQQKEHKLIGSIRHHPGLTLFSVNIKTEEVKPAEFVKESLITWNQAVMQSKGKGNITRKIVVEKDCIYIEALNKGNALKKYRKLLEE